MKFPKKGVVFCCILSMLCHISACGTAPESAENTAETSRISSPAENAETEENNSSSSGAVNFSHFDPDAIIAQCSECAEPFKYYNALLGAYQHINNNDENSKTYLEVADEVEERLPDVMNHQCTAPVVHVENMPLVVEHYYGFYTGDWQGMGPCGTGKFEGSNKVDARFGSVVFTYNGSWDNGLPNGYGVSYGEQGFDGHDYYYSGEMVNGKREGKGYMYEYVNGKDRFYDEADWQDGKLISNVEVVEYLDGEIYSFGKMTGYGNGSAWTEQMTIEQLKEKIKTGAFVIGTVVLGKMFCDAMDSLTADDPNYGVTYGTSREQQMAELESWRKRKEEENKAIEQENQYREEKLKADAQYVHDDCVSKGDDYSNDRQWADRILGY